MANYMSDARGFLQSTPVPVQTTQKASLSSPEALYDVAKGKEQGMVNSAPNSYMDDSALSGVDPSTVNKDWVDGYLASKDSKRSDAELGMKQEAMSYMRTDREKKRMIDDGMVVAAQKGGFNGVIDYLETADPDRAQTFTDAKLDLDRKMMQNDMYKTLAPIEKAKALMEGYGAMGKMGFALLKAPENERQSMYKTMLPMLKAINPDAPNSLNQDSVNMFQLAISQATPENQMFGIETGIKNLKGKVGDAIVGKAYLLKQGFSPDSPEVMAYDKQLIGNSVDQEKLELSKARLELQKEQSAQGRVNTAKTAFLKIQNELIESEKTFNNFNTLYKDPARGKQGYANAVTQTVKASGDTRPSDKDKEPINDGAGPLAAVWKGTLGVFGKHPGGIDQEWDGLKNIQQGYYDANKIAYEKKINAWAEASRAANVPEADIQDMLKDVHISTNQQKHEAVAATLDPKSIEYLDVRKKQAIDSGKYDPQQIEMAYQLSLKKIQQQQGGPQQ